MESSTAVFLKGWRAFEQPPTKRKHHSPTDEIISNLAQHSFGRTCAPGASVCIPSRPFGYDQV